MTAAKSRVDDPVRGVVTIAQACVQLGVSRSTIQRWLDTHTVEWKRTAGGSVRIFTDSLWKQDEEPRG